MKPTFYLRTSLVFIGFEGSPLRYLITNWSGKSWTLYRSSRHGRVNILQFTKLKLKIIWLEKGIYGIFWFTYCLAFDFFAGTKYAWRRGAKANVIEFACWIDKLTGSDEWMIYSPRKLAMPICNGILWSPVISWPFFSYKKISHA